MSKKNISVITCSMNRHDDLIEAIKSTQQLKHLEEHIIINWSSKDLVPTSLIKHNSKLRIFNVQGEKSWWLSRAYNFGAFLAKGDFILKLDADTSLKHNALNKINLEKINYLNFTHQGSGFGNFLITKKLFEELNGFNEYIYGWGYDDIDFHNRAKNMTNVNDTNNEFIEVNDHSDNLRFNSKSTNQKFYNAIKMANHKKNKYISQNISWNENNRRFYKKITENTYEVVHFFSVLNLTNNLARECKKIFLKVFVNEYFGVNINSYFQNLFYLFPQKIIYYLLNVRIFPKK